MFAFDEPYGFSVFCDDIRAEVGGKASFIGVYNSIMFMPSFPAVLPKFGIIIFFNEPAEMIRTRDFTVNINVFLPGQDEPIFTGDIPPVTEEVLAALTKPPEVPDEPDS